MINISISQSAAIMTEAYDSYEKELLQFFQNARDDIAAGGNGIKDIFASIDEILGYMDFEIRSQSAAKKKELQDRTVEHKSTYRKLQTEANRSKADGNKAALLGGKSEEARQRVLNLHDKYVLSHKFNVVLRNHVLVNTLDWNIKTRPLPASLEQSMRL